MSKAASITTALDSESIVKTFWRLCLIGTCPQTKPKKRSRRYYLILTATVLSLAIIVGVIVFELSNAGQTSYGPGPVNIEVTTDKPFYLQGEEVYFIVYVNNPQDWPVPYPSFPAYSIDKNGVNIAGGGVNINYAMPIPTFPAHSRKLFNCSAYQWNQKMYLNGNLVQAQPGNYTLTVYFEGPVDYGDGSNCNFEIRPTL